MLIYYVYAYIRSSDGTPYYIGKGKGNRAYEKAHSVTVPSNRSKIVFLEINLSEVGALALERRYVRWYGRKDLGTGILYNRTDGGDGVAGRSYIMSDLTKHKLSEAKKGILFSEGHKENLVKNHKGMTGRKHSEETKRRMSESMKRARAAKALSALVPVALGSHSLV